MPHIAPVLSLDIKIIMTQCGVQSCSVHTGLPNLQLWEEITIKNACVVRHQRCMCVMFSYVCVVGYIRMCMCAYEHVCIFACIYIYVVL